RGLGVADLAGKGHGAADQRPPPPTVAGRLGTRGEGQVGVYALERARRRVAISPLAPDAPLLSAGGDRRGSGLVHTGEREEGGRSRPRTVTQFFCQSERRRRGALVGPTRLPRGGQSPTEGQRQIAA